MKVRELIARLKVCDPDLQVAYPYPVEDKSGGYSVVFQLVTTTEIARSSGELTPCVMLNPTFVHLDRAEAAAKMAASKGDGK